MEGNPGDIPASHIKGAKTSYKGDPYSFDPNFIAAVAEHHGISIKQAQEMLTKRTATVYPEDNIEDDNPKGESNPLE